MARKYWISAITLYTQGFLMLSVGLFTLLRLDEFVAATGKIARKQILHSMRYVLTEELEGSKC